MLKRRFLFYPLSRCESGTGHSVKHPSRRFRVVPMPAKVRVSGHVARFPASRLQPGAFSPSPEITALDGAEFFDRTDDVSSACPESPLTPVSRTSPALTGIQPPRGRRAEPLRA